MNGVRLVFLITLTILLVPRIAVGCALMPRPTILDAYNEADVVVIARAVSVEKVDDSSPTPPNASRVLTTTMEVQKVFKGNLKIGDKMTFGQGNGIRCTQVFYEDVVGKVYLFYLERPPQNETLWYEFNYSRSSITSETADDLLYLNNIAAVRGKTRVSGTLEDDLPLAGRKVRIIGKNKTFQAATTQDGVYEIYGLPPGKYLIAPELPYGWVIDKDEGMPMASEKDSRSKSYKAFTLRPKRHAVINFAFKIDNAIEGHVYDQNGRPLVHANILLKPENDDIGERSQFIDKRGGFKFESVSVGRYSLIVHEDKIDKVLTRTSLFDPNKSNLLKTLPIILKHGESIRGLRIFVSNSGRR